MNDDPYKAWLAARAALRDAQPAQRRELVEASVKALEAIKSDLDEHGEDNLPMYGNGEYSIAEFDDFLEKARDLLRELSAPPPPELPPLRGPASVTLGEPRDIAPTGPRPLVTTAGFVSHEGDKLAIRDLDGHLVRTLDALGEPKAVAVSPDGTLVAFGEHGGRLGVADVATGALRWRVETQKGWVCALAFSPDGRHVVSGGEGRLLVHDAGNGATVASSDGARKFRAAAWSEDGIVTIAADTLIVRSADLAITAQNKTKLDGNDHDLAVVASRAIVAPNNALAVLGLTSAAPAARAKLVERVQRWAGGRGLAYAHGLVAVILEDQQLLYDDDGNETRLTPTDLQLFRVDPFEKLASVRLPDFVASEALAIGGVAFASGAIIVAGASRALAVPYVTAA